MFKKAIVLAAAVALSGCYQAMDEAAREQAAAEAQEQQLSKSQAEWTQVVAALPNVRSSLVMSDYAAAKTALDQVYRQLYGVVTASDLTPEVRSRVTRLFPTLIQLQSKVEAKDKEAAVLADQLDDMLRNTNEYLVSSGWLRGGGAGRGNIHQQDRPGEDETPPVMDAPRNQNGR